MDAQAVLNPYMKNTLGIGGKLLTAFGAVALLSVLSAAIGWMAFDRIAKVQDTVVTDTVPYLNKVRSLAQISSMMIAATPNLINAGTERQRKIEADSLFAQRLTLSETLQAIEKMPADPLTIDTLKSTTTNIQTNLESLNTLVTQRIVLETSFTEKSNQLLKAVSEIVDLSEALVGNAAASTSATIASLYDMIDDPGNQEQLLKALDRLVEIDVDHMEQMFETRHRVAVSGLIMEQLGKTDILSDISALQSRYVQNIKIIERRIRLIRDPHRRDQAKNLVNLLLEQTHNNVIGTIFDLRRSSQLASIEISRLVNDNHRLTDDLAKQIDLLVFKTENQMHESVGEAQVVLQRGYILLGVIAIVSLLLAIPIMWFYVRNGVVRRVHKLASVTHAMAAGDLAVKIEDNKHDELSDMAAALKIFKLNALEKRRLEDERKVTEAELRRHKEELEQIVAKRTNQLTRINDRLRDEVEQHAEARDAAEQANRSKSAFLATMSHEIRTPITGVLGTLHILEDEELAKSVRQRLNVIRASSETLLSIINDILDYSKIEAGHLNVTSTDFDLRNLIDDLRLLMAPIAENKDIALIVVADIEDPAVYRGDPGHLRQVLINVVGNAIKFTDQGQVILQVTTQKVDVNGMAQVQFDIEDTGVGISEERQAHLFDAFYQSDDPASRRPGGTGLGLTICKRLLEAMGGHISLKSSPEMGSLFSISLPLEHGVLASEEGNKQKTLEVSEIPAALHILLVEDNEIIREITHVFLERAGHHVTEAATAGQGVEAARSTDFDLILMDVSLPDFDGLTATQKIRNMDNTKRRDVTIIAISAHVFREEIESYLAAGMDGFLGKPFTPEQLNAALNAAKNGQAFETHAHERNLLSQDGGKSSFFNSTVLEDDLPILGAERVIRLINLFLSKIDQDMEMIQQAAKHEDLSEVAQLAHAMKSAAGSLGAQALYELALGLEMAAKTNQKAESMKIIEDLKALINETCTGLTSYRDELDQETSAVNT
ncbi:MAG: TMAO reductase system sensor histidine kinase/response regulator TorS [Rhodospirillales bacterium]|jgi:two-component system, OmpR family, sensor histidine kinase TorS|nr:TMAO reductase system sensor histidine kinase/response regulator TorS [Rhodospirillales bacterium]